jgi:DNA polymerase-3 subunit delta'
VVVGPSGQLPLPWLAAPLQAALAQQRGHALLVQGHEGIGALPFVLTLAQAWLCESAAADKAAPCGHCGSCKLVQNRLHPDLQVLMPEVLRRRHEWPLVDDKAEGEDSKKKPSKQIRIDEVRGVIDWVFKTSSRGRGKVVVLHPAEALNVQSANALLKTLEEPPAGTRIVLSTADAAWLLPTVRSRCQTLRLQGPPPDEARAWLQAQGVDGAGELLAACSGRPLEAAEWFASGVRAEQWAALPGALSRGQSGALQGWPLPRVLDALHKLCHDAMARAAGASPRYFPAGSLALQGEVQGDVQRHFWALSAWSRELDRVARHDDHPFFEGLMLDALVAAASRALKSRTAGGRAHGMGRQALDTLPS